MHQADLLLPHLAPPAGIHSKGATENDAFTRNIWINACVSLGCKSSKEIQRALTKPRECSTLPGRKLPAALLKATAICLLYACFHERLFNSI